MKKYTKEQWLNLLPLEIKEKAIANINRQMLSILATSLSEVINGFFIWDSSPEGHEYWREISKKDWGTPQENKPKQ